MAVYKGDTQEEIDATDAYNMALQTLAESSVPLAGGGDFASTIRKNWPVGQMKFADGGYAEHNDPENFSSAGVMKPAGAKEWDSPTYLERLKHFLADYGPQTGTGRPTLGGERFASGVQRVLELLPVTGNIESGQRAYRDFKHGDNIEGSLNTLGALMPLNAYSQVAHGATPMVRAGNAAMLLPSMIPSDENALLPERKNGGSVNDDVSHALRIAHDEVNHYGGGGGAKITAKLLEELQSGLGKLFAPGSGYVPVPNKPATVKIPTIGEVEARPIEGIERSADRYMRSIGREGEHEINAFPEFDIERARKIAQAYEDMLHDPTNPAVKRSYDALVDETMAQYRALKDAGYEFKFNADDPYALSPSMGYADVVNNGRLTVFPTETGGFGSSVHDQSALQPLLIGVGRVGDLPNATANDAFRAVHDMYGHFGPGNPFFRGPGEERAWFAHQKMYSPEALPAMTNETRGQNSWVNYGPYAEHNKTAKGADTVFAEQKTGLMPEFTMDIPEGYARGGYATQGGVKAVAKGVQAGEQAIQDAVRLAKEFMADKLQGPASLISDKMLIPPAANADVAAPGIAKRTAKPAEQFPELAERYPEVLEGVVKFDPTTGKEYIGKQLSDEANQVAKARAIAQKEIKAGNYDPYFPPEQRAPVPFSMFSGLPQYQFDTTSLLAKTPKAIEKYEAIANDPRAEQSLIQAILRGKSQEEGAGNWYYMKQLYDKYLDVFGPEIGPDKFRTNFAESMAATTGGMSPTNNLMLAHYGNFNANKTPWPSNAPQQLSLGAYDMPYPIAAGKMGLRNNADAFNKMILEGAGIGPQNPKRLDFAANFLGDARAVMDDQMMTGGWGRYYPQLAGAPPQGMYGHFAGKTGQIGADLGMTPMRAQELGWFGFKDQANLPKGGFQGQPMISDVNQAIERTHRITGMPHDEIVERALIRQELPLYADGGSVDHALRIANSYDQ
jgi:hypothetical protein